MNARLLFLAQLSLVAAEANAATADQVLAPVEAKAAAEHKAIFLHFGVSWCGWCQ